MSATPTPDWIRDLGGLSDSARDTRIRRWLKSISHAKETSPADELRLRLNRQLEFLRDEIAEARQAGFSWSAIGAMVGLTPDAVETLHAE
jgi:hypothetical protein